MNLDICVVETEGTYNTVVSTIIKFKSAYCQPIVLIYEGNRRQVNLLFTIADRSVKYRNC